MAIEVFNRYEHKYILNEQTYARLQDALEQHMTLDPYNIDRKPYTITNLYYDTPDDYLIRASLSDPVYKEKLRLRAYGVPEKDSKVFLELKKKYDGLVNKRRTALGLDEAYIFADTGIRPEKKAYMNAQVVREIAYFLEHRRVSPKLYIAYDRVAYFEKGNDDLRISFDRNIRTRRNELRLESGDYGEKLLADGYVLMEVKTSLAKPLWLCQLLSALEIRRQSFSKYGTEFKNTCRAAGLACGVGLYGYGALFVVILCVIVLLMEKFRLFEKKEQRKKLKITIPEDLNYPGVFDEILEKYTQKYLLTKIKTTDLGSLFELEYSLVMKSGENEREFLNELRCRNGNLNIILALEK